MRRKIVTTLAGLGVLTGLAIGGTALAGGSDPAPAPVPAAAEGDDEQDPSYQSSVAATEDEGASEADEAKALAGLATITPKQAQQAATDAVPGTVNEVELDNENGSVVYSVEVTKADGTGVEVTVDAGNGAVLHQGTDNEQGEANEGSEANEANEANEGNEANEPNEANEAGE